MPTPLTPLPRPLGDGPFSTRDALAVGVGRARLDRADLVRPFAGVRTVAAADDVRGRCAAYVPKMVPGDFFSHVTAAVLHGMWLPLELEKREAIDVSVVKPQRAPRDRRVIGHHLVQRPRQVASYNGWPVADAVETWCQLARSLRRRELVVAGDSLLQKGRSRPEVMRARLLDTAADSDRPFHRRLAVAAPSLRVGVRSAGETLLRLLLVEAGLPEPEINAVIRDEDGGFLGEGDLVFRREHVVLEYEGDYHRTDKRQWRKDIHRYERMQDARWRVIRVTADDIRHRPAETIARVSAALAGR